MLSTLLPHLGFAASKTEVKDLQIEDVEIEKQRETEFLPKSSEEVETEEDGLTSLLSGLGWEPTLDSSKEEISTEKVESDVYKQLKKQDTVDVIVKLKDQVDMEALYTEGKGKAKRVERLTLVKQRLEDKAKNSQKGVNQALSNLEKKGKAKVKQSLWITNSIVASVDQDALEELKGRDDIEKITLDAILQLPEPIVEESKPRLPEWGLEKIYAPKVWGEYGEKGEGIVVGIMDTGVDGNHEALKNNYRGKDGNHQYSWADFSGQNYKTPTDGNGHGTHVAGTAVGGGAGEPIGVAPEAEWIAAKIFTDGGSTTLSAIHSAFQWFMAPGGDPTKAPDVVNNSWGNANSYNLEFYEDVQAWVAAGIFPLFAAGNDGPGTQTIGSPGSFLDSFAIGATDSYDQIAYFSSRGPVFWTDENGNQVRHIKPDVAAPGHHIYSAWPTQLGEGKYRTISGTSMATPHVAGAIALLLGVQPDLTIEEVKDLLKGTARVEPHMGILPNDMYGSGIVNIYQAVTEAAYAGELKVKILSESGEPVLSTVEIPSENKLVNVSEDGEFSFKLREGTHKVTVNAFGFETFQGEVKVTKNELTEVTWELKKSPTFTISGSVVDQASQAVVPFAYVRLKGTPLSAVRSNLSGEYKIEDVPAGEYELVVSGEGIKGQALKVTINANLQQTIEVELSKSNTNSEWTTANNNYQRNAVSPNAIDVDKLTLSWNYSTETKGDILFSTPAVTEDSIVLTTEYGWIVVLDSQTGEEKWSIRFGSMNRSSPTVVDGKIYLSGGADGTIYALDVKTGTVLWSKLIEQTTVYESPLYRDGVLYVGSGVTEAAKVYALDADTGEILWSKDVGASSFFGGTLGTDYLYIGTYENSTIRALSLEDGTEIWNATVSNEGFASRPVYKDGFIYVNSTNFGSQTGTLHVYDANTGEEKWSFAGIGDTQAGSPIVYEELVIVSSAVQPILRALDRETGAEVWTNKSVGTTPHNGSVSANGVLFYAGTSGVLYALDVYSGQVMKEFSLPDYSTSGLPIVAGNVVVPYRSGIQSYLSPGILKGTIKDDAGNPIDGTVSVLETGEVVKNNAEGAFELKHKPGSFTVKIAQYGKQQVLEPITFVSGYTETKNYSLVPAGVGSLKIEAIDQRTQSGLGDVKLYLSGTPIEGVTNEQGMFEVAEVFEGTYELTMTLNGYIEVKKNITISKNQDNPIKIELQPVDIAVLNDWNSEVTSLLNVNGHTAEERDWDIVDDIHRYQVVYLNGAYGSGGWQPDETQFKELVEKAKQHDVSLIFADAWGSSYGSIRQLTNFLNDPKEIAHHYGSGIVRMQIDQEHPIFEGYQKGDRVNLYSRTGDFAWFNDFSGRHLGSIGSTTQGFVGTGVAYKAVSENSAHLLLASHGAAPWISPLQGWLSDQQKILLNGIDFLQNSSFGKVTGTITDSAGNPIEAEVQMVETGVIANIKESAFEMYHDEGKFEVEIRASGFETQRIPVTISKDEPVTLTVVLQSSSGGSLAGIIVDDTSKQPITEAKITVLKNSEVASEVVTGENGRFEITGLENVSYQVKIEKEGYILHEQTVVVANQSDQLEIALTTVPAIAVLGDYYSSSTNFASIFSEIGVGVTSLSTSNVVKRISEFDVVFVNDVSTYSFSKAQFEELLKNADEAGTSLIFGDSYFSSTGVNLLVNYREDPQSRGTIYKTTVAAQYKVLKNHPILAGAKKDELIELLLPSGSRVGYFNDYSGYPLATIQHEGDTSSKGLGVAYKPRTANSVELLMSGHGFSFYHNASHYTDAGKQMFIDAVLWAAKAKFSTVSGTITDEEGNSLLADVTVKGEPFATKTNVENGEFSIAMEDGSYEIEVSAFGYENQVIPVTVGPDSEPIQIQMNVNETVGSISGMIEDKVDGNPFSDVEISVIGTPRQAVSDTQGKFTLGKLLPDTYTVVMKKDGYVVNEQVVEVKAGETTNLSVKMKPSPTIGVIVDVTSSGRMTMKEYLLEKGYKVMDLHYTDLDKISEVDLIIANSDYDNSRIPTKAEFEAFQEELDTTKTSVIWTGQFGGRGSIRYLYQYENNPAEEIAGSKAGMKLKGIKEHPILEGVELETLHDMPTYFDYYYTFDGYDGTTIAEVHHEADGKIGDTVAFKGRTSESVEILLANMTFSHVFHPGDTRYFDPTREQIFNNAVTWALDQEEALVSELYGSIKNNHDLEVQSTVTVKETGKVVKTDEKGLFYLGLPEGTYTLEVKAFGHFTKEFTVEVKNGERYDLEFVIESDQLGTVTGTVNDGQTGDPIAGAQISIIGTPIMATTDESGSFKIGVPMGEYDIRVSASGYAAQVKNGIVIEDGGEYQLSFSLAPSEKIGIVATSLNGDRLLPFLSERGYDAEYLENTNLGLIQDRLDEFALIILNDIHYSSTNDDIREFIEAAKQKEVSIIFGSQYNNGSILDLRDVYGDPASVRSGYVPRSIDVKVVHDHPIFAGLTGDEIKILSNGTSNQQYAVYENYSGTTIGQLSHEDQGVLGDGIGYQFTSANSVHVLLSGLQVSSYGYPESRWTENAKTLYTNAIDWAISASLGEIKGTVTDEEGQPIANAKVAVISANVETVTNAAGEYRIGIGTGSYEVEVAARGFISSVKTADITTLGESVTLDFTLKKVEGVSVSGIVTDKLTEEPVSEATVTLTPVGDNLDYEETSDEKGFYQFKDLLEGEYELVIKKDGYIVYSQVITVGIEDVSVNVSLDAIQVAVLGDYNQKLEAFLTEQQLYAEARDWDVVQDIANYKLVVVNTNKGTPEQLQKLISVTDEQKVSVVFLGTWGLEDGSIQLLEQAIGYPQHGMDGYNEGAVYIKVHEKHPIFEGLPELIKIHSEKSPYGTFMNYPGHVIGDLLVDEELKGSSIAYEFRSIEHMHLLLSSYAVTNIIGPDYGWTEEGKQLFTQSLRYAMDGIQEIPAIPVLETPDETNFQDEPVIITGKSEPLTTIELYDTKGKTDSLLASGKTKADGTFEIELELKNGSYFISSTAENFAGKTEKSNQIKIVVSGKPKR